MANWEGPTDGTPSLVTDDSPPEAVGPSGGEAALEDCAWTLAWFDESVGLFLVGVVVVTGTRVGSEAEGADVVAAECGERGEGLLVVVGTKDVGAGVMVGVLSGRACC